MRVLTSLVLSTAFAMSGVAQSTKIGESCDLAALGAKDAEAFRQFDAEFRDALASHDAGKMALLMRGSLRVNGDSWTYYVQDARSLQGLFDQMFPPKLREIVAKQPLDKLWCSGRGLMYGNGDVWVQGEEDGYSLEAVNLPSDTERADRRDKIRFTCRSAKSRAIVDGVDEGKLRLRSWQFGHSTVDKPDVVRLAGKETSDGTGECRYTSWIFVGDPTITLEELGCSPESDRPANARGQLHIKAKDVAEEQLWCF